MRATINGKRYDTDRCEILGEKACRDCSNNYCGTSYLLRASDGTLLVHQASNGQSCHFNNGVYLFDNECCGMSGNEIDAYDLTPEQEKRCEELGILTIVD